MRSFARRLPAFLVFPALFLVPGALDAQLPLAITIEARGGWAVPMGDFANSSSGFAPGAGPAFAVGGRIDPFDLFGIFVGYQQIQFECEQCAALELDDAVILDGIEAGIQFRLPYSAAGYDPWIRGAILRQKLSFSGLGETLASEEAIGFGAGAGLTIPLTGFLRLSPGLRFVSVPGEFTFETLPERSLDATALTFDLGVELSF